MSSVNSFNAFDAYVTYLSFKLHFSSNSYDFFKFHGKTKANIKSFESRKDRYQFEKIAAKLDRESFIQRMLVEYIDNNGFWIKDIFTPENKEKFLAWKGYIEAFEYSFKKELGFIKEYCLLNDIELKDIFKTKGLTHPQLFKMYLRKDIRIETFICIDNLLGISKKMNDQTRTRDPIWEDNFALMKSYYPFVQRYIPEKQMLSNIFLQVLT